jgi:Domain of unknown function (DUF4307)
MSETATPRPPVGRYGPEPDPRRRTLGRAALATLLALAIAAAVWVGLGPGTRDVTWDDVGYVVQGPDLVDVTFEVVKDPDATATCTVQALSSSYAEVGVVTATVGPAGTRAVRQTVPVATQELAVTGVVESCELVEP